MAGTKATVCDNAARGSIASRRIILLIFSDVVMPGKSGLLELLRFEKGG